MAAVMYRVGRWRWLLFRVQLAMLAAAATGWILKPVQGSCLTRIGASTVEMPGTGNNFVHLFLNATIECDGLLTAWEYYRTQEHCTLFASVWRQPVNAPQHYYTLVGKNSLPRAKPGFHLVPIAPEEQIKTREGDFIGIHYSGTSKDGCVAMGTSQNRSLISEAQFLTLSAGLFDENMHLGVINFNTNDKSVRLEKHAVAAHFKPNPDEGAISKVVCYDQHLNLDCGDSRVIAFVRVLYGRLGKQCGLKLPSPAYRCSKDITEYLSDECAGKRFCQTVVRHSTMGGDPCRAGRAHLHVKYKCVPKSLISTTCNASGAVLHSRHGYLQSPNYPEVYKRNHHCIWTIQAKQGQEINIRIYDFKLDLPRRGRCGDSLIIYQINPGDQRMKFRQCRNATGKSVRITSQTVKLEFRSHTRGRNNRGFLLSYKAFWPMSIHPSTEMPLVTADPTTPAPPNTASTTIIATSTTSVPTTNGTITTVSPADTTKDTITITTTTKPTTQRVSPLQKSASSAVSKNEEKERDEEEGEERRGEDSTSSSQVNNFYAGTKNTSPSSSHPASSLTVPPNVTVSSYSNSLGDNTAYPRDTSTVGIILGAIIGAIVLLLGIIIATVIYHRKKKRSSGLRQSALLVQSLRRNPLYETGTQSQEQNNDDYELPVSSQGTQNLKLTMLLSRNDSDYESVRAPSGARYGKIGSAIRQPLESTSSSVGEPVEYDDVLTKMPPETDATIESFPSHVYASLRSRTSESSAEKNGNPTEPAQTKNYYASSSVDPTNGKSKDDCRPDVIQNIPRKAKIGKAPAGISIPKKPARPVKVLPPTCNLEQTDVSQEPTSEKKDTKPEKITRLQCIQSTV